MSRRYWTGWPSRVIAVVAAALVPALFTAAAQQPGAHTQVAPSDYPQMLRLAEDYKAFMNVARTELETVARVIQDAERGGFRAWRPGQPLATGGRYYINNRDRAVALIVVGAAPIAEGVRVAAAHVDSPRLELKARPLYESQGFGLFQTNIHGNILTYQWANIPLALIGRATRRDGSSVRINVGLEPGDPVFVIPALSTHVDIDLRERRQREVLLPEELDPIVASTGLAEGAVVDEVLGHLRRAYGLEADDMLSSELALVPAHAPRDVGFDRALMAMYGQDDRFSAFAAARALIDTQRAPDRTAIVYLPNNEEADNVNNTGAGSEFFRDLVGELLLAQMGEARFRDQHVARALQASRVLSLDVNDGINPTWPGAWEPGNAPRLGHGVNFKVYGRGMNATSEYTAWLRAVLDDARIPWQIATYKVGRASGGTLGRELSRLNMDVIDLGAPVLSIHGTYDVSAKADLWWLYRASQAFFTAR